MDIDVLISEVFKRPPLWDQKNLFYKNRNHIAALWAEIEQAMDFPGK